ncbi:MAG: aldo/keto reductase [Bacillota bacterium]|nr:aldo/keto reductase [Bacillota bacterium]
MQYGPLGATGAKVSRISLGCEHITRQSHEEAIATIREAVDRGVNYFDALWPHAEYRDTIGKALSGLLSRVMVSAHISQPGARDGRQSLESVEDFLRRVRTDHVDVAMIQYVQNADEYRAIVESDLLETLEQLKRQGKARFIGMSSHVPGVLIPAIQSGTIDIIMAPVNPCWCPAGVPQACHESCRALVAMKPYHGGWFFHKPYSDIISPGGAISYAMSQPGVSTVLTGVKNRNELCTAVSYFALSESERNYSGVLEAIPRQLEGICVFCDHCLPCSAGIDITQVNQCVALFDREQGGVSWYQSLSVKASACTECGACVERCPLAVDIISHMKRAVQVFGV